jgi:hypothetical protein
VCGEHPSAEWKGLCSPPYGVDTAAIRRTLVTIRPDLHACLGSAEASSWVRIKLGSPGKRSASRGLPESAVTCVADRVDSALSGLDTDAIDEIVVPMATGEGVPLPKCNGDLSKEAIQATIESRMGEVHACADAARVVWPDLAGRTSARFIIAPDGRVATVRTAASTVDKPALECCINTAVRRWRFEPPCFGVVVVNYPFVHERQH